ncbi:MAG: TetR/AcrR family transcriptional regulator [Solirubrobacteraceae bacterium]
MKAGPDELLAAAQACFADAGIRATSLVDVADRAGVSRATAYRALGDKRQLVQRVVADEVGRFLVRLEEVRARAEAEAETPREALVAVVTFILDYLEGHTILQRVLRTEPESLVGLLVEGRGDPTLISLLVGAAAAIIEGSPWADDLRVDAGPAAELTVRVIFSLLLVPSTTLGPPDAIADLLLHGVLSASRGGVAGAVPD